ncbi:glucosamine-6-phosphate deaminase [Paraflavisolibacter sp. H34]|uniref:glucosamine-6-phosphate deaminase n=1 Tax=Huijunlia imazamoxiresistens TaxID=3127457 RepID=UPI00301A5CE8
MIKTEAPAKRPRKPLGTAEKMNLEVFPSAAEASRQAAAEIAALIRERQEEGRYAVLGLATGSTPKKVYQELIALHRQEGLSFRNVIAFNLDEYYGLEREDPRSYYTFMQENLFRHTDILPQNCHIPDGSIEGAAVNEHCRQYEQKIQASGGIDLQLLGIGRNGHIGFNEPGSSLHSTTRLITLDVTTRTDAAPDFGGIANVPRKAITMGIATIRSARRILMLAWGEKKASIIKNAVEGPVTDSLPASHLQGHQHTTLLIDTSCAAALTRTKAPWLFENIHWDRGLIKRAVIQLAQALQKPVLKLTNADYNENGLSQLLALSGDAYDLNIDVFNQLQRTITGWPGGKPGADDTHRPERAAPDRKRVLIFSPHPDDDIISMGGTFQRLVDQGHEVHVAYQTSGNIAVADDEALRFIEFVAQFNRQFHLDNTTTEAILSATKNFLREKTPDAVDLEALRRVKGLIRKGEALNTCRFVGVPEDRVHFLNLPFYETGRVEKMPLGEEDYRILQQLLREVQPHQVFAAGDLADPHGTHKVCLDALFEAVKRLENEPFMKNCRVWLYKGAWAEWDLDQIEMAVPMSPEQVLKKRHAIFKHQSQKDGVVFQGEDNREFWQRAEERNRKTADLYNQLGLAEYEAMEAFVSWNY